MSLPSKSEVLTGQYSSLGSPHVKVTAKSSISSNTNENSLWGTIFYPQPDAAITDNIAFVNSTAYSTISHFNSTTKASISKIADITV